MLEIDQCATTFVMSGPLIKVLQNIAGSNMMSDMTIGERSIQDINRQLRHIKVYTNYQGYKHKYTFNRLVNKTVASVTFEHEGKTVTMQQYYSQVYKIRLQYPRAPVAEMTKKCFIPLELLFVCDNQRYNMQLTPFQLSQMIKTTASTPRDRKQGTVSFIQANTQFRLLKELEIDIDRRLLDVNAYQLKPPVLDIGGKTVADSSWRNGRFVEKMSIVGAKWRGNRLEPLSHRGAGPDEGRGIVSRLPATAPEVLHGGSRSAEADRDRTESFGGHFGADGVSHGAEAGYHFCVYSRADRRVQRSEACERRGAEDPLAVH